MGVLPSTGFADAVAYLHSASRCWAEGSANAKAVEALTHVTNQGNIIIGAAVSTECDGSQLPLGLTY